MERNKVREQVIQPDVALVDDKSGEAWQGMGVRRMAADKIFL